MGDWERRGVILFFFGLAESSVASTGALRDDVEGVSSGWLSSRDRFTPSFS
jgi:hypothetical protein